MKIIFISSFDFSSASAGKIRQDLIISTLQRLGFDVLLLNLASNRAPKRPFPIKSLPDWLGYILRRLVIAPWVFWEIFRRTRPGDMVISFDRTPLTTFPAVAASRLCGISIVQELTEHPKDGASPGKKEQVLATVFEKLLPRFDGFIVISSALRAFVFERVLIPKIALVSAIASEVPLQTESENFALRDVHIASPFTFLYAGSLSEPKDGVLSLVAAFAEAFSINGAARLEILGYGSDAQKAAVRAAIVAHGVAQSVTLFDPVAQSALPARLAAADALVLCRPLSRQATHGFPTKLAEYLAAGRPVIVTLTSDIGHYLRDGVSAFLVPPNDVSAFANAMQRAASDRAFSVQIGQAGHAVFLAEFEAERAVRHLADWLRSEFPPQVEPV